MIRPLFFLGGGETKSAFFPSNNVDFPHAARANTPGCQYLANMMQFLPHPRRILGKDEKIMMLFCANIVDAAGDRYYLSKILCL